MFVSSFSFDIILNFRLGIKILRSAFKAEQSFFKIKKAGIDNALKACQTPAWETYFRVCTKSLFIFCNNPVFFSCYNYTQKQTHYRQSMY